MQNLRSEISNRYKSQNENVYNDPYTFSDCSINQYSRQCFVGGVHPKLERSQIEETFKGFGEIETVSFHKKSSNVKKGFCIIKFMSENSAKLALSYPFSINIEGFNLTVEKYLGIREAADRAKERQTRKLYVSNIPNDAKEQEILTIFEKYGEVEKVSFQYGLINGTKTFKGFAFILMKKKEYIQKILRSKSQLSYNNQTLVIKMATMPKTFFNRKAKGYKFAKSTSKFNHEPENVQMRYVPKTDKILEGNNYVINQIGKTCCLKFKYEKPNYQGQLIVKKNYFKKLNDKD